MKAQQLQADATRLTDLSKYDKVQTINTLQVQQYIK